MNAKNTRLRKATFAGGCFWCMEHPFDTLGGVLNVISGYTGGHTPNPTYDDVVSGENDYVEAVQITYDPDKISYEQLLDVYWRQIDPTDTGGAFTDRGKQYRTAIFYHSAGQKRLAIISKKRLEQSGRYKNPIVTQIHKLKEFYMAEEHHQKFYKKHPLKYKYYRHHSGRDQYLYKIWGK